VTELRWVLLLIALVVLVGLFVWTRFRHRLPKTITDGARAVSFSRSASPDDLRVEPVLDSIPGPAPDPVPVPALPDKIVTIRLMSRASRPFPAEDLVLALRDAGLRHGRFGIFHHFAAGHERDPVFSVASLVEPGSFDLTRLQSDAYPGVSLFMGLPGPVDGVAAFDAMLNAARQVAARLGGDLVDEQGSTLSVQRERYLREEVIQFQHRRGRPG